jgi:hypothetical protein
MTDTQTASTEIGLIAKRAITILGRTYAPGDVVDQTDIPPRVLRRATENGRLVMQPVPAEFAGVGDDDPFGDDEDDEDDEDDLFDDPDDPDDDEDEDDPEDTDPVEDAGDDAPQPDAPDASPGQAFAAIRLLAFEEAGDRDRDALMGAWVKAHQALTPEITFVAFLKVAATREGVAADGNGKTILSRFATANMAPVVLADMTPGKDT